MSTAGKQKLKRMDSEDGQKGQGGVEETPGQQVLESKVAPITQGGARLRLVSFDGGRKVEEADQRLDEQKEFEKFWASFQEFDR